LSKLRPAAETEFTHNPQTGHRRNGWTAGLKTDYNHQQGKPRTSRPRLKKQGQSVLLLTQRKQQLGLIIDGTSKLEKIWRRQSTERARFVGWDPAKKFSGLGILRMAGDAPTHGGVPQ
jgi:hypothetical protein